VLLKAQNVVSSNFPDHSPWNDQSSFNACINEPGPSTREWIISGILFTLTLLTTSFAGFYYVVWGADPWNALVSVIIKPKLLLLGLPFSIPLVIILLVHEMGHFLACRYYGMRCTPPFFIPVPLPIAGTLGAFIKIKSQFNHRRALFDMGIAGPLAGFLLTLPTLWIGISLSTLIPKGRISAGSIYFGEPLIFRFLGNIILGYSPEKHEMLAHPIAIAASFGLLATSINLLPIWQLDGGHISYAFLGRSRQKRVSIIALIFLMIVSFSEWPPSYVLFLLLLLAFGIRFRFYHPPALTEDDQLGSARLFLALLALLIFIVSFTPVPIRVN
jgi:membrane-associated protease RseP (regulator of RpoE activity)